MTLANDSLGLKLHYLDGGTWLELKSRDGQTVSIYVESLLSIVNDERAASALLQWCADRKADIKEGESNGK